LVHVSKGVQIAVGASLVAVLLGWYGMTNLGGEGTFRYYQTLEEFRSAGFGGAARVHGYVALGSIERDVGAREVRFAVQNDLEGGETLPVVYRSLETPDLFKDGAEVVVEGRLSPDGAFHATNVLAKCPSKFAAKPL
jgi:cytochrome c-type biogenesis protein CcmE